MLHSSLPSETKSNPEDVIHRDDFTYIEEAINAYSGLSYGKTFAVKEPKRANFFKQFPLAKRVALSEKQNPLLEEGTYANQTTREHKGEYFLPYLAVDVLVRLEIIDHKPKPDSLPYNTKNIFVINNDKEKLLNVIKNLDLKPGEDAKFIYIDGIHGIPFYLRNEAGCIKCLIIDSMADIEKNCKPIANIIQQCFENPTFIFSSESLQRDWYSCTTFSIKILRYFAKHGAEIFTYLNSVKMDQKRDGKLAYSLLKRRDIMPKVAKLTHYITDFPAEKLAAIVSRKKGLILYEYLKKYSISINDKDYNYAVFRSRYKLFKKLHEHLANPATFLSLLTKHKMNKNDWVELCKILYAAGYDHLQDIAKEGNTKLLFTVLKQLTIKNLKYIKFDEYEIDALLLTKNTKERTVLHDLSAKTQSIAFLKNILGIIKENTDKEKVAYMLRLRDADGKNPLQLALLNPQSSIAKCLINFYEEYLPADKIFNLIFKKDSFDQKFLEKICVKNPNNLELILNLCKFNASNMELLQTGLKKIFLKAVAHNDIPSLEFMMDNKIMQKKRLNEIFTIICDNQNIKPDEKLNRLKTVWKLCEKYFTLQERCELLSKNTDAGSMIKYVLLNYNKLRKLKLEPKNKRNPQLLFSKSISSLKSDSKLQKELDELPDLPFTLNSKNQIELHMQLLDVVDHLSEDDVLFSRDSMKQSTSRAKKVA